jgi:CheY-like chemotaxis protein
MKRVLILDDNAEAAAQLADRLALLGFQAVTAETPQRAVEEMQGGDVAVLVAGQHAGGRPGIDMIKLARQVSPRTRSLLLGAEATAREYKVAIEQGAVDVLTNPFTERDLVHAIRKALECEQGFHGSIHGLGLVDLLQMVHYSQRSLVIRLGPESSIHMLNGDIVHAVAPPLFGREALQQLLSERSGSLSTAPFEPCARTINSVFEPLLLDVLCKVDEDTGKKAIADTPPEYETIPLPPPVATARPVTAWTRMWPIFILAALVGIGIAGLSLFVLAPKADTADVVKAPPEITRPGPVSEPLTEDETSAPAPTDIVAPKPTKPVVVKWKERRSEKKAAKTNRKTTTAKAKREKKPALTAAVDSAVRDDATSAAPDATPKIKAKPKIKTKKKPKAEKKAPKTKNKNTAKPQIGTVGNPREPNIGVLD